MGPRQCISAAVALVVVFVTTVETSTTAAADVVLQLPVPSVGPNLEVPAQTDSNSYAEVAAVADPANPANLFIGSNSTTLARMGGFKSGNGGSNWSTGSTQLPGTAPNNTTSDPAPGFDASGNLYYAYEGVPASGSFGNQLVVSKSTDDGLTWNTPTQIDGATNSPDRPALAVDTALNRIYVAYDRQVAAKQPVIVAFSDASSCCGGQAWPDANKTQVVADNGQAAVPVVDRNGNVFVAWDDISTAGGQIDIAESSDNGQHYTALGQNPVVVAPTNTGKGVVLQNFLKASCPTRKIWSAPALAVDASAGQYAGDLYAVWMDNVSPAGVPPKTHIYFSRSVDGGKTWSTHPTQIDIGNPVNDSWEPAISVDPSNEYVTIAWYDRRDDVANTKYKVYYTESTDGGQSFLPTQVAVSTVQSDPTLDCFGTGDYMGIVSRNGVAHPVWTDSRLNLPYTIFTASVAETTQSAPQCFLRTLVGGYAHSLAVTTSGTVSAWGFNDSGDLGDGSYSATTNVVQVVGSSGSGQLSGIGGVAAGEFHSLALKSADGTVWAWGYNADGELGNADSTGASSAKPVEVVGNSGSGALTGMSTIAAGAYHSMAISASDGSVYDWGSNFYGQLGNGQTSSGITAIPVHVAGQNGVGYLTGIVQVVGGESHSLALQSNGTVWAWGYNSYGQLGNGNTTDQHYPVKVSGLPPIVAIAAGDMHSLALDSSGNVWAWGYNNDGELGNNTTTGSNPNSVPTRVLDTTGQTPLSGIAAISSFGYHSLALKHGGTLLAWGYNYYGQLGDGTSTSRSLPVQVQGQNGVGTLAPVAVSGGLYHSLALNSQGNLGLTSDGTVSEWGFDGESQSQPGTVNSTTPVQVGGLTGVATPCS